MSKLSAAIIKILVDGLIWTEGERAGKPITAEEAYAIRPRYAKSKEEQKGRTKGKAEVFTPTRIVREMLDEIDKAWSGGDLDYIVSPRLEITCGEGAFLTTRYEPDTGEVIPISNRAGILDRKLVRVGNLATTPVECVYLAGRALASSYGYEYQGDSCFLARKNCLLTVLDYLNDKGIVRTVAFSPKHTAQAYAKVIAERIIQMDGLKYVKPLSCSPACKGCKYKDKLKGALFHDGEYVEIPWGDKMVRFVDLLDG